MKLQIESVTPTKTGKSLIVKAGGKDYFAKKDSGIQAGMTIEADTEESEYQGKTNVWIKAWQKVQEDTPQTTGTNGVNLNWLPFASNAVAHAITAGLIKGPGDIKAWVHAVKEAVETADTPF